MKHIITAVLFAGVLSGCASVDTASDRSSNTSERAATTADIPMVDAVTRKPVGAVIETAPAPSAPAVVNAEPTPLPTEETIYSGERIQQFIDPDLDPSTARSYNATWSDGGFRHRSVMFPHIIDGCKVMIQSRRTLDYVAGTSGEFFEREGPDCNCDLVIDGFEGVFAQLNDEYKTPRMYNVCAGPGVDGGTRQLEIMRESLKEVRNFDKMKNVDGF